MGATNKVLAALQTGLRPREERITVLIPSRMRLESQWLDVVIHNVSSRGLMAGCDAPPAIGSYVEIRRGSIVIVGRVQWNKARFFGIRTQDRLSVRALIDEPRLAGRPPRSNDNDSNPAAERRADRRLAHEASMARQVERSRGFASAFQFVILVLVGLTLAGIAAHSVYGMLSAPTQRIEAALKTG
ncbi:PilZ domain-containing protein [Sphingomonas sp. Leaf231]|uniref:PilZ domain-containing protein n=1 Tax=Sphingomonas sp. Leaf231 TaxID=1736301 RepID=UPI000AC629B0|nr:PilZ domain-containing protein [Sphingomonas sp. Leaf231]